MNVRLETETIPSEMLEKELVKPKNGNSGDSSFKILRYKDEDYQQFFNEREPGSIQNSLNEEE